MFAKQTTAQHSAYKAPVFRVETWLFCCLLFPASFSHVLTAGNYENETETEECRNHEECLTERVGRRIHTQRRKPARISVVSLLRTDRSVSRGNLATFATRNPDAPIYLLC
jgi:hypothetical protein